MNATIILLYALVAVGIYGLAALCLFVGFLFGRSNRQGAPAKSQPVKPQPDPESVRRAKRLQKEVTNMLTYNGDEQEEITDD